MGAGGHEPPYKVPDWRIFKVEDAPELVQLQKLLAQKGLKDPWIRNEVWRYNPKYFGTHAERAKQFFFRGFKWGFVAFVATIAVETLVETMKPSQHDHH